MFKITETAAKQVRVAAKQSGAEGMALRMAARQKEDGTIDYLMGFDEAREEDIHTNCCSVEIVMAPEAVPLLEEAVMDYVDLDEGGGYQFIFINPKDANYTPPTEV